MSLISTVRDWWRGGGAERLFFIVSLCFVAFCFGVGTMRWKMFPYPIVKQAFAAIDALQELEDDRFPPQIQTWEPGARAIMPIRRLSAQAGSEDLMITGGFYSRMDLCPRFGCLAWITTREGRTVHTWPAPDPAKFFNDLSNFSGKVKPLNVYVIGAALQSDGSLITTFHGHDMFPYQVGVAKFARDGHPLWKRFDYSHHWPAVGSDGRVYAAYARVVKNPPLVFAETQVKTLCKAETAYMEGVRVYSPDGVVEREFPIADAIARADYPGMAYAVRDRCDPHHVNSVDLVTPAAAARLNVDAGDLLISLREPSVVVILDKDTGDLKRLMPPRAAAQHGAKLLPNGDILVFDNLGGRRSLGGSRLLRIDPTTGASQIVFPQDGKSQLLPFYSEESGAVAVSPDGARAMVSSSKQGRTVEVDLRTGQPLWVIDSVMDFGPFLTARHIKRETTFARTTANGVQYVAESAF